MSHELVSIIIPVYRAESYLRHCLDSVVKQTHTDLEIICVNDGSPDNSIFILYEYAERDGRFLIIDKENEGVSAARNEALRIASGKYIAFLDADDWIDPQTIEIALDALKKYASDIAMWSYVSEHGDRQVIKRIFNSNKVFDEEAVKAKLYRRLIGLLDEELAHPELADSLCPVWGKLYKTEFVKDLSFIDLSEIGTYEDGLFNLEVFAKVQKAVYLDRPFYHYRRGGNASQTSGYRPQLYSQWQRLFDRMQRHIDDNKLSREYEDALSNRVALSIIGLGLNIVSAERNNVWKTHKIRKILQTERYVKAYNRLEYRYFPVYWKLFFVLCRKQNAVGIVGLLQIISLLLR